MDDGCVVSERIPEFDVVVLAVPAVTGFQGKGVRTGKQAAVRMDLQVGDDVARTRIHGAELLQGPVVCRGTIEDPALPGGIAGVETVLFPLQVPAGRVHGDVRCQQPPVGGGIPVDGALDAPFIGHAPFHTLQRVQPVPGPGAELPLHESLPFGRQQGVVLAAETQAGLGGRDVPFREEEQALAFGPGPVLRGQDGRRKGQEQRQYQPFFHSSSRLSVTVSSSPVRVTLSLLEL